MIMLATTTTERIHGKERAAIINTRMMIFRVTHDMIRTGYITKGLIIRHQCRRITIKCHILTVFSPIRIATDLQHNFIWSHLLHKTTGFSTLPGIKEADTCIFVRTEHAPRYLTESPAHQALHIIAGSQHGWVPRKQIISSRLTETLRYIYIMPVRQLSRLCPVGRIFMYFFA